MTLILRQTNTNARCSLRYTTKLSIMKSFIKYSCALLMVAGMAACSSNSKTSADSDTTTALSTKPEEQAPVNTSTPKADTDTLAKPDSAAKQ